MSVFFSHKYVYIKTQGSQKLNYVFKRETCCTLCPVYYFDLPLLSAENQIKGSTSHMQSHALP